MGAAAFPPLFIFPHERLLPILPLLKWWFVRYNDVQFFVQTLVDVCARVSVNVVCACVCVVILFVLFCTYKSACLCALCIVCMHFVRVRVYANFFLS